MTVYRIIVYAINDAQLFAHGNKNDTLRYYRTFVDSCTRKFYKKVLQESFVRRKIEKRRNDTCEFMRDRYQNRYENEKEKDNQF